MIAGDSEVITIDFNLFNFIYKQFINDFIVVAINLLIQMIAE